MCLQQQAPLHKAGPDEGTVHENCHTTYACTHTHTHTYTRTQAQYTHTRVHAHTHTHTHTHSYTHTHTHTHTHTYMHTSFVLSPCPHEGVGAGPTTVGPVSEATSLKMGEGLASHRTDKLPWSRTGGCRASEGCPYSSRPKIGPGGARKLWSRTPGDRVPMWRVL